MRTPCFYGSAGASPVAENLQIDDFRELRPAGNLRPPNDVSASRHLIPSASQARPRIWRTRILSWRAASAGVGLTLTARTSLFVPVLELGSALVLRTK